MTVGWGNLADVRVNTYVVSGLKPMYLYLYLYVDVSNPVWISQCSIYFDFSQYKQMCLVVEMYQHLVSWNGGFSKLCPVILWTKVVLWASVHLEAECLLIHLEWLYDWTFVTTVIDILNSLDGVIYNVSNRFLGVPMLLLLRQTVSQVSFFVSTVWWLMPSYHNKYKPCHSRCW